MIEACFYFSLRSCRASVLFLINILQDEFAPSKKLSIQKASPYLFVFLGASNLARGYSALADCLVRCLAPDPVEILHAMGPGRGYCARGGVFNITYPPIGSCGILKSAINRAQGARHVVAFITDIGNDIMYDVPVSEITSCLDTLFQNFEALGFDVIVNPIPLDFSEDVSKRQFRILRSVFYPHSSVGYSKAANAVTTVNGFLRDSVCGRIHLLPSMKNFCGVDKIHYSIFRSHKAWSQVAVEMFRILSVKQAGSIGGFSMVNSLFANMGRLVLHDMTSVGKKSLGTF